MKQTKHILATIAMLLCCLTASAIDFGRAGFYFSITSEEDLTVEVTEYDKEYFKENYVVNGMFSVTIPDIVSYNSKKYRVASIGEEIFSGCSQLSSVTIPEGVTEIGEFAFRYCENLGRITFPGSLTTIGDCAFYNCSSLTSINIPKSVTSIGNSAFSGCTVLRYFTISENSKLASIGDYAFSGCTGLTSITIPNGVTEIGEFAFSGCTGLTSITIPNGVIEIGEFAFRYCSGLVRITLPEGVTSIGGGAFSDCSSLTSINIPKSVTSIGKTAFSGCSRLTSINIPESVTTIGDDAFYNCSALASINISEDSQLTSIGGSAFYNCSSFTSINIPESVTSIGESAFAWCSSLASITISENSQLNSIGNEAFYNCGSLRTVYISRIEDWCKIDFGDEYSNPTFYTHDLCLNGELVTELLITEGVTSIGNHAFQSCSSLTSVTLPESVMSIGNWAFDGCGRLTSLTFSENSELTSIGNGAFYNCSGLTSIIIPEGVTEIGSSAFRDCSSLTSIVISETSKLTSIGYRAFRGCSALTSITLPEGVTSIGNEAFYNCSSLDSIAIPEEVTSIGEGTFSGCSSLTSITISGNVNSIGNAVFSDCTSLKEVIFEDGIRTLTLGCNKYEYDNTLGEGLFYDCPLKIVYLGRSLSHEIGLRYGYSPFYKKSLESLTIGEKVTVVGNNVFNECTANSITSISQSPPTIYSSTFSSMQRYLPVYVPASSVSAYKTADYWSKFDKIQAISISHIALSESSITLTEGEVFELAVTISPKGAEETLISWSSNSPNIASVDNTGKVTAIAPGTTTITAQANEGSGVNASCEVTVEPFKGVTSLDQLNNETLYYIFLPKHSGGGTSWAVAEGDVTLKSSAQLGITPDSNDSRQHFAIISNDVGTRFLYHVTEKKFVCKNGELSSIPTDAIYFKDGAYAYTFVAYFDDSHYVNVEADGTLGVNERSTSDGGNSFQIFSVGIFDSTKTPIKTERDGVVYIFMPEIREAEVFLCNSTGDVIIPSVISYNAEEYSVTSIGKSAFSGCSRLTSITIPSSVTSIGESAFYKCRSLTSITIPENSQLTSIGNYAFSGCWSLTTITIPEGVTTIGDEAFYNCSALASINISEDSQLISIGNSAFEYCSSLTSITIPENSQLTSIGNSAFEYCSSLTSIILPESVTEIGNYAFDNCTSLKEIIIEDGSTTLSLGYNSYHEGLFYDCPLEKVYIGRGLNYDSSYGYSPFYKDGRTPAISLGDKITSIGDYLFYGNEEVVSITLPESVTSIGSFAFYDCSNLTSITIPENSQLTSIGNYAFSGCWSLTTITIPEGVMSIGNEAFRYCSSLKTITLPEGVTSIGDWAFSACSSLTAITIPENSQLTSIGNGAFGYCRSLTSITLPESVTSIGNEAFSGCSRLLNVTMQAFDPPLVYDGTFPHYDIELYVPKGSVKAYRSADYWNMFTSIQTIIVKPTTGKNYRLKNVSTGLYLQVSGNNTNMTLQNKTAGIELAQVFQLEDSGDGKYYIKAADIENNYYAHASGWNFKATNNSANKTPFTIALVEGETEVYTLYQSVSSHIGNAGTDASGAGSPIYCDKRADQNGKWVFEALTRKENAEYVNAFTAVAKEQLDVTIARAEAVLATRSALLSAEEVAGIDSAVQTAKEDKDALTEVGALKALSDAIDAVVDDAIYVQSLDALSNGVCYVVATENRGAWYAQDNRLNSTTKIGVGVDITDVRQQFAFVRSPTTGDYYLYSVGEEKFVKKEGSYTALAADPEQTISFLEGTRSAQFPWVIAFNGENGQKQIAVSNNYDYGIITFYNDLGDGGNTVRFEKVATFNASAAIDAIRKYENDDVTSIANSQSTIHEAQFICDLHGRRVAHPTKGGIYIVNGRKVVIK